MRHRFIVYIKSESLISLHKLNFCLAKLMQKISLTNLKYYFTLVCYRTHISKIKQNMHLIAGYYECVIIIILKRSQCLLLRGDNNWHN